MKNKVKLDNNSIFAVHFVNVLKMSLLPDSFVIPIVGLIDGEYHFTYTVDASFFKLFENSPVKSGLFNVEVELIKTSSHLELTFDIGGVEHTTCDRCLADISLPVSGSHPLIVKYDDDEREEDEIIYIGYNRPSIDLSKYIYEFICLQVPMTKLYNCEDDPSAKCDIKVLDKLDNVDEEDIDEQPSNSWAESLKNLKL